jgi:hypothetical protein
MRRFLLFASPYYYAAGGWNDFISSFDTLPDAITAANAATDDRHWWHIVDTTIPQIVLKKVDVEE